MTHAFSLYLDILRFLAAAAVLLSHANIREIIPTNLYPLSLGHNAVVIFFVLSGYVVAFVADTREQTWRAFWVSRFARVYSVALPALIMTVFLDIAGEAINAGIYANGGTTHDYWWLRLCASLLFVNELWTVSIMPFSNSPYWSLCYEVCYYVLFSVYCFEAGLRRVALLTVLCLLIGPKILLMLPVWALGVFLYRYRAWYRVPERLGWLLWIGSLLALAFYQYADVAKSVSDWFAQFVGADVYKLLHFSKHFLSDYLLSCLVAANFVGSRAIAHRAMPSLDSIAPLIKRLSAYTFALYLCHVPILMFFMAVFVWQKGTLYYIFLVGLTFATCLGLGAFTEAFKNRLKAWLGTKLPRVSLWAGRVLS